MQSSILQSAKKGILRGQLKALQTFLNEQNIAEISANEIRAILRNTKDLSTSLQDLCPRISAFLHNEEDFGVFLDLVGSLWNALPSQERGADPAAENLETGPVESMLIEAYMNHIQDTVDPSMYISQKEIDDSVHIATEEWLSKIQPELDGRTPRDAVADERRESGRTDLEWSIMLNIHAVDGSA